MRDLDACGARARGHPWGGSGPLDRVRNALTYRSIRRVADLSRPLDVLEIGFGRGLLLRRFVEAGHRAQGVDPGSLERGLDGRVRALATLHLTAAEEMNLAPGSLDLAYGIHVVEHLRDPLAVFRAVARALRPGGVLYLMTPNAGSDGLRLFRDAWWNLEDPTHVRFFSPRSIGRSLADAGFGTARIRRPAWDSLTMEGSSLLRMVPAPAPEHGVMTMRWSRPVHVAVAPLSLLARLAWPPLAPSMEVVARRP